MPDDPKALPAPPRVTAVVMRNQLWEAQIGADDSMTLSRIGPQGGRHKELILTAAQAASLLDLVEAGRHALERMAVET